jgi:hypothetical protein
MASIRDILNGLAPPVAGDISFLALDTRVDPGEVKED